PGDAAEIELGPLSSRALKRRLGQAAKQTGYSLKWARDGGTGVLRFQVREARGAQTKARNGRRGRRRRAQERVKTSGYTGQGRSALGTLTAITRIACTTSDGGYERRTLWPPGPNIPPGW